MKRERIIIVGGVAGGATALARLRRLHEQAEIILFERGPYISYANCGLPYYIGGEIKNREALFVTTPEMVMAKYGVEIRTEHDVTAIDREAKAVEVTNLQTGETFREPYDRLLLATGSKPIRPDLPGLDAGTVFSLWTVPDTDAIMAYLTSHQPERAVVVGGGFIGIEMAENLANRGLQVTVVEMAPQILAPFDPDMSILLENELRAQGVDLKLGLALQAVEDAGRTVVLGDGTRIGTDLIILSIGCRPTSHLAAEAGLELNARGGIVVDDQQQTSDPAIFAVGDAVEIRDFNTGGRTQVPLAGPANKQGRIAADVLCGLSGSRYRGTQGTSITRVFDLTAASTGQNERQLQQRGQKLHQDYDVTVIHPMSHAGYFPGATPMTLKLLYRIPDGKILGAQIVGGRGVDKRLDILATAMHFGGTVQDLQDLELGYAPPYSAAKDPVNMAGYAAGNQLGGLTSGYLVRELPELLPAWQLLDVREHHERLVGQIPDALHIPLTELRQRLSELDPDQPYLVFCSVGLRGYLAERVLKQMGYRAANLLGGYRSYDDSQVHARSDDGQARLSWSVNEAGEYQAQEDKATHSKTGAAPAGETQQPVGQGGDSMTPDHLDKTVEIEVDACGLSCPGPIVKVAQAVEAAEPGARLRVWATDPGFARDIASWCENTGHRLLAQDKTADGYSALIEKGSIACAQPERTVDLCNKEKTMIVFSGDLDKAIAAFIIANGAAAMGNKVNLFFTFWGLNILRRPEKVAVKKSFISRMFSGMMPRGSRKLGLSRMNFGGAGARMIRGVMAAHQVSSLEELIADAQQAGVKLTACQMSMDLMGITEAELIPGVDIGGVAAMLNDNDHSNMNLFI